MAMTKKDYEAFAALNRQMFDHSDCQETFDGSDILMMALVGQVRIFSKDNPRFDAKRFLLASGCGTFFADKLILEALNNG